MSRQHVSPTVLEVGAPSGTATVDVSVVIVTYNVRGFLEQALRSVEQASSGLEVETWVVDNDSADGSVEMVRERFPDVELIANQENVGFATANNQAIRQAAGRYVLVLNPDTILQEDTLRELVAFMDAHPDAGAAGCRILNPDGTFAPESRRAFPDPAIAFYRISGLSKLFPKSPTFGRYNLTYLPIDEVCEVDALSGSCMMVRTAAVLENGDWGLGSSGSDLEDGRAASRTNGATTAGSLEATVSSGVTSRTSTPGSGDRPRGRPPQPLKPSPRHPAGLFDEGFFMYGEDLDWCYRIQQAGWRIYYTPSTQIVHYKGESTKKGDLRYVLLFYGAMLRFVEKHVTHREGAGVWDRLSSSALALGIRGGIVV
ncbi:glycosyltransferase family 2 protein, partial [Rubrivirga sp.]|uniref:glycosyltransferase family 2 protein n=1 Tax=Rubrivirga sp. TaxID=1885344 RepID=UPI003C717418